MQKKSNPYQEVAKKIFALADITINGDRPWDIQIHNPKTYSRLLTKHTLGFGETYMQGWWDCKNLDTMISKIILARLDEKLDLNWREKWEILKHIIFNTQTKRKSLEVARNHYDLDNALFKAMLDKTLTYSCAYWKNATDLDEAQQSKLRLVANKLNLQPNMKLLDIGCGWGSMVKFAASNYQMKATGITLSQKQYDFATKNCREFPIDIKLQDYRDIQGIYDRIVSIGMFEHVGYKNYRQYMETVYKALDKNGLFLLHTIGRNNSTVMVDPWFEKYIFPNSMLPSLQQITKACENLFVVEDIHNLGMHYDKTLMAWHQNFINHWESLSQHYDEHFKRMWEFYLLSSAGAFRCRSLQVWQIVFSKDGAGRKYESAR